MPRKKNGKASRLLKNQNTFANYQKQEKDFLNAPNKLVKQLTNEIKLLKQNEKRFNAALKKIQSSIKTNEKRLANPGNNKKAFKNAEKLQKTFTKEQQLLNRQIEQNDKQIEKYLNAQNKLNALKKELTNFDKSWESNAKKIVKLKKTISPKSQNTNKTIAKEPLEAISEIKPATAFENISVSEEVIEGMS